MLDILLKQSGPRACVRGRATRHVRSWSGTPRGEPASRRHPCGRGIGRLSTRLQLLVRLQTGPFLLFWCCLQCWEGKGVLGMGSSIVGVTTIAAVFAPAYIIRCKPCRRLAGSRLVGFAPPRHLRRSAYSIRCTPSLTQVFWRRRFVAALPPSVVGTALAWFGALLALQQLSGSHAFPGTCLARWQGVSACWFLHICTVGATHVLLAWGFGRHLLYSVLAAEACINVLGISASL